MLVKENRERSAKENGGPEKTANFHGLFPGRFWHMGWIGCCPLHSDEKPLEGRRLEGGGGGRRNIPWGGAAWGPMEAGPPVQMKRFISSSMTKSTLSGVISFSATS